MASPPPPTPAPPTTRPPDALARRLRFYRFLVGGLAVTLAATLVPLTRQWLRDNAVELGVNTFQRDAPHSREIATLIGPLRYSGLATLLRPDVRVEPEFSTRRWHFRNVHRFDPEGRILLEEGKYGVCGDLAVYTYQNIRPLFDKRYVVQFLRVAEASFFPPPRSTHYVIRILDTKATPEPRAYILDPAFRRYGGIENFEDYLYYEALPQLPFMAGPDTDDHFAVDQWTPIRIRRDSIISLAVESREGRYDPDNFAFTLYTARRHRFYGRRIFRVGRKSGQRDEWEDAKLALSVLEKARYEGLRKRVVELFEKAWADLTAGASATGERALTEL